MLLFKIENEQCIKHSLHTRIIDLVNRSGLPVEIKRIIV
jgi:hypothetical protein